MNKTHPRIFALLLAVCLVLPLTEAFSGCRKKTEEGSSPTQAMRDPATGEYAPMENAATLTGIYRAAEVYRYEGEVLDISSDAVAVEWKAELEEGMCVKPGR